MSITKNDVLFCIGILTAIWFALTGMFWTYFAALFIAYPFGIVSFIIWRKIRSDNRSRNKYIPGILIAGLMLSLSVLLYFLLFE